MVSVTEKGWGLMTGAVGTAWVAESEFIPQEVLEHHHSGDFFCSCKGWVEAVPESRRAVCISTVVYSVGRSPLVESLHRNFL